MIFYFIFIDFMIFYSIFINFNWLVIIFCYLYDGAKKYYLKQYRNENKQHSKLKLP